MTSLVRIRQPVLEDQDEFLALVRRSRSLHEPWTAAPSTATQFRSWVERSDTATDLRFVVCLRKGANIAAVIEVTNIVRGPLRSAYLGYYTFAGYERQGLMSEGLRAVITYAFTTLKLHRLEANIQPANVASIALVQSCGFSKEGYSPRYLKIRGRWRDHERWAILAS
jgi:[ribosomal protein S5]-alanine N-acetyltransferase